uniref:Uncharacterized protein n=1 Tax=Megaselia scalaris TaxID=36166 RepID=T1GSW4_MEGSC
MSLGTQSISNQLEIRGFTQGR